MNGPCPTKILLPIIILILFIVSIWGYQMGYREGARNNHQEPQIIYKDKPTTIYLMPEFEHLAQDVANSHDWAYNKYMCVQFSRDLVKELNLNGYNARSVTGFRYENGNNCSEDNYKQFNCLHTWVVVEVPVEATTGSIIPAAEYKYYKRTN